MSEPHLLRVHVSSRLIAGLLCFDKRPTCEIVVGLPEDARLYRCSYDFCTDCFVLVFEHPTFPKCEHGTMIKEFFPMVQDVPKGSVSVTYPNAPKEKTVNEMRAEQGLPPLDDQGRVLPYESKSITYGWNLSVMRSASESFDPADVIRIKKPDDDEPLIVEPRS